MKERRKREGKEGRKEKRREGRKREGKEGRKKERKLWSVDLLWGLTQALALTAGARLAGVTGVHQAPRWDIWGSRWHGLMPLLTPSLFQNFAVIEDPKFPLREFADYLI